MSNPQDVKPEAGGEGHGATDGGDEYLTLKVVGQDGAHVQFKTKRSTQLRKLMKAYCERMNLQMGSMKFLFDGDRVQETQTPAELNLEDGDQIDAMVEQLGGFDRCSSSA